MRILILALVAFGVSSIGTAEASYGKHNVRYQEHLAVLLERHATYLPRRYQRSNVIDATGFFYKGAATLVRSKNRISGRIMTNVPTAGDPYTLWVLVFNNPAACADVACGESDIANPDVNVSIFNGSGAVSASNGKGGGVVNMDFEAFAGKLPNGQFFLGDNKSGLVRNRGFRAHVALVVDQHPPLPLGMDPWLDKLTQTNQPTDGPAVNNAIAVFLPCPKKTCPDTPF